MLKHRFLLGLLFSAAFIFASNRVSAQKGRGGHYAKGSGSSHKGGSYKNTSTNNHYKKRKG